MLAAHRFEIAAPPPAIDVAGQDLASSSTTWTALPDLGETTFSAADSRRELDYMHARYRSPLTSRFLSTDPIGGSPKSPQSWNRYAYTRGNPLKFIDPDGRSILHYIRAKWAQAASNALESGAAAAGVVADFTPVVGDGKAIYEAYKNPTALNIVAAAVGLAPGLGDAASKGLKLGANVVEGAAKTASDANRLVIGRGADLATPGALGHGEFSLSWPPTGGARSEWKTNSGLLRQEMGNLRPIRDASVGDTGGMYLNAERNLLGDGGWQFDANTSLWMPPLQ